MDDTPTYAGTLRFEATLDTADALDLNRALTHGAATLKALGSQDSLDVRRAAALGELARTQTALNLYTQGNAPAGTTDDGLPVAREVVLHAHFNATTGDATAGEQVLFDQTGRLAEGRRVPHNSTRRSTTWRAAPDGCDGKAECRRRAGGPSRCENAASAPEWRRAAGSGSM